MPIRADQSIATSVSSTFNATVDILSKRGETGVRRTLSIREAARIGRQFRDIREAIFS